MLSGLARFSDSSVRPDRLLVRQADAVFQDFGPSAGAPPFKSRCCPSARHLQAGFLVSGQSYSPMHAAPFRTLCGGFPSMCAKGPRACHT